MLLIKMFVIAFIALYLVIWIKYGKCSRNLDKLTRLIMCLYVVDVLLITIFRSKLLETRTAILIPGKAYYTILTESWVGSGKYVAQALIGNVLLFIPFGLYSGKCIKGRKRTLLIGVAAFCVSFGIEIVQYIGHIGTFEVDDLIHNTWGAVIGESVCETLQQNGENWESRRKMIILIMIFMNLLGGTSLWALMK